MLAIPEQNRWRFLFFNGEIRGILASIPPPPSDPSFLPPPSPPPLRMGAMDASPAEMNPDGTTLFCGMVFAFSGKFKLSQPALKSLVEAHGGACAASVTQKVTHVVTTTAALASDKRATALATAIGRQLPLISESFLTMTSEEGVLQPLASFALDDGASAATASAKQVCQIAGEMIRKNEVFMIRQAQKRFQLQALWAWADRVEGLESARKTLVHLARRMRLESAMGAFFCAAQEKHADLDSVTDAMAKVTLDKPVPLEQQAAASLQPADDARVRILVDTNIYMDLSLAVWDDVERLHKAKAKIMIPHVVSTLNPQPQPPKYALHTQPQLNLTLQTLNLEPYNLGPQLQALNPKP